MPSLNINSQFAGKKATTIPFIPIPKDIKQSLNICKIHPNGIFKIEPVQTALYDRCYIFEDVNYVNQDEDKKTSTLLELMKLHKSMSSQFKFTLANEQRDMEAFIKEVFRPIHGEEYPELKKGVGGFINQKLEEGTRDIKKVWYLTVTVRAKSFEEALSYFATMDTTLRAVFASLKSGLYCMSGKERLLILQRMLRAGIQGLPVANISEDKDGWKNQILPARIDAEEDYLKINDRYACVMFAHDYEQTLDEEKVIHGLTDVLFPIYITLDIEPVRKRLVKNKLLNSHTNNERVISQERSRNNNLGQYGAGVSYSLDKKKTELEELMDQVDSNDEEAVFLGMLVMVIADGLDELSNRVDTLTQIAVTNGYTLEPYYHRQLKALNTILPIGGRQVNAMRSLLTSSAVAFQPFHAQDLQDEDAFVYGLNTTTKHLIRGDRKKLSNPHGMLCGHSGGGKSFLIKETEIAQSLLFTDDDVIALDPNNEQEKYINLLRGQYFDFTPQCAIHLNAFEVPDYVECGDEITQNKFIATKTDFAGAFCISIMKNIVVTQVHLNYIGRSVRQMYEEYFKNKSPWKRKKQPTLIWLRELLKEQIEKAEYKEDKRMLIDIVDCLEEYTVGVYDMFAHPSNLDINSRLVGFGLKNIPESVKETVMLTVMHFLTMRIEFNQEKMTALHLIVDEAQVLCEKETTAAQLLYAIETYRKVGAIVTLAVQNLTRVIENESLRDMFSNCQYKCFLDQGGIDAANLATIQEFSEREFLELERTDKGHGVMVWGNTVYLFDAKMSEENILYPALNTDFHEKAEEKRKAEQI